MFMLKRLTDPALKRLYKFVLKRVIGRFLLDELDLDQLDVHLRSGQIELCDLALDVALLNTYLVGMPFHVQSGYLGSVKASISYSNIVTESCVVEIDEIDLVLVPAACIVTETKPEEPTRLLTRVESSGEIPEREEEIQVETDETSREGLDFVANWIEQISTKIKVSFSNITCRFQPEVNDESEALVIRLKWAEFCDETPIEQRSLGSSINSFTSAMEYGVSHKGIKFSGITVQLDDTTLLQNDQARKCYVKLKIATAVEVPEYDIDVFLHSLQLQLEPCHFTSLLELFTAFTAPVEEVNVHDPKHDLFYSICQTKPTWLVSESKKPSNKDAIDLSMTEFQRIEAILQRHQKAAGSKSMIDDAESVESDLEEFFECETGVDDPDHGTTGSHVHRRIDARVKLHLLECKVILVYLNGNPERERLELMASDILCCFLSYPTYSTCSITLGSFQVNEFRFASRSDDDLLNVPVLFPPVETSIQLRMDQDESKCSIKTLPFEIEWDMSMLKRIESIVAVLATDGEPSNWIVELTSEKIQVHLRFPLVSSDPKRYGRDSIRDLCQDQLILTFSHVQVLNNQLNSAGLAVTLHQPLHKDQHSDAMESFPIFDTGEATLSVTSRTPTEQDIYQATTADPSHSNFIETADEFEIDHRVESTSIQASYTSVCLTVSQANMDLQKEVYDRLLILIDALLSVDAVPVTDFMSDSRDEPCFLSFVLNAQEGRIGLNQSYNFDFKDLKIFHVSEWLGRPVSRLHMTCQDITLLEQNQTVLTKRKEASTHPQLLVMVEMNDMAAQMRDLMVSITFHGLVLSYDVDSCWLFNILDIVMTEYPEPVPANDLPLDFEENLNVLPERKVFTKLFVNCFHGVIDYSPDALSSRLALVLGSFKLSSNLVTGATMQGYKFLVEDISLYVTNDASTSTFEENEFLQLGMLDTADIFLKSKSSTEMSVELSLGLANFFTCSDSCQTLLDLVQHWWDEYSIDEDSQERVVDTGAYVGVDTVKEEKKPAATSVLEDIDENAFASHQMLSDTQERMRQTLLDGSAPNSSAVLNVSELVIEDYYTMEKNLTTVQETTAQVAYVPDDQSPWFNTTATEETTTASPCSEESTGEQAARWIPKSPLAVVSPAVEANFEPLEEEEDQDDIFEMTEYDEEKRQTPWWGGNITPDEIELEEKGGTMSFTEGSGDNEVEVELDGSLQTELSRLLTITDGESSTEESEDDSEKDETELVEEAKWYQDPNLRIFPHHVEIPVSGKAATLSFGDKETAFAIHTTSTTNPAVELHLILREFSVRWRLFGGKDWPEEGKFMNPGHHTHNNSRVVVPSNTPSKSGQLLDALLDNYIPETDTEDQSLFSGQAKSVPTRTEILKVAKRRKSASRRRTEQMLEISLSQVQFRLDQFQPDQPLACSMVLNVGEIEVLDYISTSQIRKMICYWKSDYAHPRETGTCMIRVHLMAVRPGPKLCVEHRLKCRILPLRINLDQDVIDFLREFFTFDELQVAQHGSSTHEEQLSPCNHDRVIQDPNLNVGAWFFQSCDIRACKIKIDYRPERVDYTALRAGDYLEVINLFVLEGMELVLRHVKLNGIDGWGAIAQGVLMSWVGDISRHQIHKCVASVSMPPMRSLANLGSGAADLILLPMEQYSRDRRVVKGIKRGAHSFLKTVTIETLNTVSKVARGTQALLEHADDVVSSDLKKKARKRRNSRRGNTTNRYLASQPAGAREGLTQAYSSISREIQTAANTIIAVPMIEFKKTGPQGYVKSVIRAVPVAVLRPMIGATEAVSRALIGVRNQVDPEMKEDMENKFKDIAA